MPLEERRSRYQQMLAAVHRHDIHNWYSTFVLDLTGERLESISPVDHPPYRSPEGGQRARSAVNTRSYKYMD